MERFDKLVRDRIPEIITAAGERPITEILDEADYLRCLEEKLDEEVGEYHRDKTPEELADILEVVFSLGEAAGVDREALLTLCGRKRQARGGFQRRIFLVGKERL